MLSQQDVLELESRALSGLSLAFSKLSITHMAPGDMQIAALS